MTKVWSRCREGWDFIRGFNAAKGSSNKPGWSMLKRSHFHTGIHAELLGRVFPEGNWNMQLAAQQPTSAHIANISHRPGFEGVGDGIHIAGTRRRKPSLEHVAADLVSTGVELRWNHVHCVHCAMAMLGAKRKIESTWFQGAWFTKQKKPDVWACMKKTISLFTFFLRSLELEVSPVNRTAASTWTALPSRQSWSPRVGGASESRSQASGWRFLWKDGHLIQFEDRVKNPIQIYNNIYIYNV